MLGNNIEIILLLMLIPLGLSAYFKYVDHHEYTWGEVGITVGTSVCLILGIILLAGAGQVSDVEVWNGEIVSKDREHGQYSQPITTCSGSGNTQVCTTTYIQHYTVDWTLTGNFGGGLAKITLDRADTTSRSVYNRPDPPRYTNAQIGGPMSIERTYTNYVQAIPDSLFNNDLVSTYSDSIPTYPRVHDYYKYDRVVGQSSGVGDNPKRALNRRLNEELKTLGGRKKVNPIVILTDIPDQSYFFEVQNAWIGGNINDVVTILSVAEDGTIQWADMFTYANSMGNEFLQANMRQRLIDLGSFSLDGVQEVIVSTIDEFYDRPREEDFQYLEDEIVLPWWVILATALVSLSFNLMVIYFMRRNSTRTYSWR